MDFDDLAAAATKPDFQAISLGMSADYRIESEVQHIESMKSSGRNEKFLPEFELPEGLVLEADLETAVRQADEILIVVPSHAFVTVLKQIAPWLKAGQGVAWACKGLEPGTGQFLHEPAQSLFGDSRPLAVVTGPSFAREVAANLPTAITVAGTEPEYCAQVATALHGENFRAYTSDDIRVHGRGYQPR